MDKSLVPMPVNEFYIAHAEYQGCFIKVWANLFTKKRSNMEKYLQDYNSFSKEFRQLDLYGNTQYVYVWESVSEVRVYRCQIISSNLMDKMHTIILIDYGRKMVVSFLEVREVIMNIDQSLLMGLSQKSTVNTFLLSEYISKKKSVNDLNNVLCNKYYKYRRDFEVGGITFITLYDVDKRLVNNGLADCVDITAMMTIANNMSGAIALNNKNDVFHSYPIPSKVSTHCSFIKSQYLDCITVLDVAVTRIFFNETKILLTVRTIDSESKALCSILDSLDRQNLKLAPVLDVYTTCLIVFHEKLVRAIILEVKIDKLNVELVDYGVRELVPRAAVFEIPTNCKLFEMRSLNVILDKPKDISKNKKIFVQTYYQMLPIKVDPNFGLYKVKLFQKDHHGNCVDIFNSSFMETCDQYSKSSKLEDFFSITEINEEIQSIENTKAECTIISNDDPNNQCEEKELDLKVNINPKNEERIEPKDNTVTNNVNVFLFLKKHKLEKDCQEIIGSLIYYKSPFNFCVRLFDLNFESYFNEIKTSISNRCILTISELVKNMYVIFKNQSNYIFRAQVVDIDTEVNNVKLLLVDEGDEIAIENIEEITLYNFVEDDCKLPAQLVLNCSLSNIWFPCMNVDTTLMLEPFFNKKLLYKIIIVKNNETGVKFVQMIKKDSNIDISVEILEAGFGQRLCAAIKTDETPYEEDLLVGQSFLSYIYYYHLKLCIQPEPNTVDELEEEIQEYILNIPNPKLMDVNNLLGTYCLATLNNDTWYRAYVKNVNEESVIVNMFDIGLLTDVPLNQIQSIPTSLMKKPQLCINCVLETKDMDIKITEKTLYYVTAKSITTNKVLCITVKEHLSSLLSNPIVRGIERISFVHVDGDLTYLQRYQDKLKADKMSETLSKLVNKLENKSLEPGDVCLLHNHGQYFRCLVKSLKCDMAVVQCIDFGFRKEIEKTKLQYLGHSKMALLPALVITVKSFPIEFNLSNTFLANMSVDSNGTLNVCPNNLSNIYPHNKLTETLKNGCLAKVTCVNSDSDCWVVPDMFFDTLKIISDILIKTQSKMIPGVTEIGALCAALHSKTKIWHRALILNKDQETGNNMLSIDSGERFKALKITKLVCEVQKIPNCALHCQVVSNFDIKKLLNKCVNCKLVSFSQPLLEIELFSDDCNETRITSTEKCIDCKVIVCRFESFDEFYVKKIDENYCSDSEFTKQLTYFTDKSKHFETSDTTQSNKVLPDVSNDPLCYQCCLEKEILDDNLTDSTNLPIILDIMMACSWTMKTSSDSKPYKVSLLSDDGENCIDKINKILQKSNFSCAIGKISENDNKAMNQSIQPVYSGYIEPSNSHSQYITAKSNSSENSVILPESETVTIKYIDSLQSFYAHSESLSMLYMEQINNDLDVCVVEMPINECLMGSIVVTYSQNLNGIWCRAKVDQVQSDYRSAYCYLLDYGSYEECYKFYKPTDFLRVCPPLVRRCSLHVPKLDGKENEIWYSNIDDMFRDILNTDGFKFNMAINQIGDPCVVTLRLDDSDVSDMLVPIYVQVSYVNSLTDFRITVLSPKQKMVTDLLNSGNVTLVNVDSPSVGNLYLAEIKSKLKRVKLEQFGGIKYVIVDIDDTLDTLSVDCLFRIPESINNIPIYTMFCSFLFSNEDENMFSLTMFQKLAYSKRIFVMCIITESDGQHPHMVKLYLDNKDVLDLIKKKML